MAKRIKHSTPITSQAQFKAMAAARAAQEGRISPSQLYGPAKQMYESMPSRGKKSPKSHMQEVAGKRYKKLPKHVKKRKSYMAYAG